MNNERLAGASTQTRCPSCEHHPILLDGRCLDCGYSQMTAAPPAAGPSQSVRSAGVLLWVNNEQILVGLKRDPKKGLENFGGKIKKDESWRACATRELKEESGLDCERLDIDWSHPVFAPKSYHVFYNGRVGNDFELANLQPTTEMAGFEIVTAARLPQNSGFRLQEVVRAAIWTPTSPPPAAAGSPDTSSSSAQEQLPQTAESLTSAKRSAARAATAPKAKKERRKRQNQNQWKQISPRSPST